MKAGDETAQLKQAEAAKSAQSLEEEREKAAASRTNRRDKSWPRARSNIVKRSRKNASAAPHWRANSRRRSGKMRSRRRVAKASDETAQIKQAEAAKSAQSVEQEREKNGRPRAGGRHRTQELAASTEQHRQALEEERARGAALARELATAQRENEKQAALLKASDETAQLKQAEAAKSAQSFEEEREEAAALAQGGRRRAKRAGREHGATSSSARRGTRTQCGTVERTRDGAARNGDAGCTVAQGERRNGAQAGGSGAERTIARRGAEEKRPPSRWRPPPPETSWPRARTQHRQALEEERARRAALGSELATAQHENETQAAQLRKASDEAAQLKQAAESATAELRQYLQQERDRTEAMARDLEPARRTVGVRIAPGPATSNPTSRAAQTVEVAAAAQPAAAEAKGGPEATRLIARASALLGQGDIGSCADRARARQPKRAAQRRVSCSQRHMILPFCPHGGLTERAAR